MGSYRVSIDVLPKVVERNKRVSIEWPGYSGPTAVEWAFQAPRRYDLCAGLCVMSDSMQGFTLLIAGMKAGLEHGVQLNLTLDRYPKA